MLFFHFLITECNTN